MSTLNMILAQVTPADTMVQQATDTLQQAIDTAAQVVTDSAAAIAAATAPANPEPIVKELSVWDLTMAGGWLMIPLALLAIVSIYIFFERLFAINRANRQDNSFMDRIKEYIHRGEVDQALKLCQDTNTPYSRMIEKGVSRIGRPMNDVLVSIENVGNMEVAKLEKGFNWLATTAAGAPMIGFLGTVRHLSGTGNHRRRSYRGYCRPVCLQLPHLACQQGHEQTRRQDHGIYGPAQRARQVILGFRL